MFGSVLVVVDSSPASRRALQEAIRIARADRARLTMLMPVAAPPWWVAHAPVSPAQLLADVQGECATLLRELAGTVSDDVSLTTVMPVGGTADTVLNELARRPHDLVVVGESARSRLRFGRSPVARLAARCRVPLLVVPAEGPPAAPSVTPARAPRRPRIGQPVRL